MDWEKLTEQIREYTKKSVKKSRYEHSKRVAEMCAKICRLCGLDDRAGYLAGIGHDMCKDLPYDEMIRIAKRDGNPISQMELENPSLLHGRAAAVVMKEKFGIKDNDILEAVANHTSGIEKMCDLTKALFLADKIEPGRPQSTSEYREKLLAMPLSKMFYSVFEENYQYLLKKGYEIYPNMERMLEYYRKQAFGAEK